MQNIKEHVWKICGTKNSFCVITNSN